MLTLCWHTQCITITERHYTTRYKHAEDHHLRNVGVTALWTLGGTVPSITHSVLFNP